jgi:hypothetical protein
METLIIAAHLINPPSETLAFRTVTLFSSSQFHLTNLIEVEKEYIDIYYHFMRRTGTFDFIKEIVTPTDREEGIRIDTDSNYPLTIVTDRIIFGNVYSILGQLKSLTTQV